MRLQVKRYIPFLILTATSIHYAIAGGTSAPSIPLAASKTTATAPIASKPLWSELTQAQKQALSPLVTEWDKLHELNKKKWLEIANRYATMKPDEQLRMQERMRDWVKLTPEQRMAARENFANAKQVKPEQRSAQWQQYQQLSEEEKKRLAAEHNKKKSLTNLSTDALKNQPILAPLKTGPKPIATNPVAPVVKPVAPVVAVPASNAVATPASAAQAIPEPVPATTSAAASQTVAK